MLAKQVSPPRLVGAVGVPALGTAPVDRHVELAVGPELVDAEQRDLRMVRVPRRFRGVRNDDAEPAAVVEEVLDRQVLVGHDGDVVVEPRAVDRREAGVVQRLDVDAADLGANLRPQASDLDHVASSPPGRAAAPGVLVESRVARPRLAHRITRGVLSWATQGGGHDQDADRRHHDPRRQRCGAIRR
jgi:hypothetical protein